MENKQKEIYEGMFNGFVGRTIHETRITLRSLNFKPTDGVKNAANQGSCTFQIAVDFDLELFYDEDSEVVEKVTLIKY